MNIFHKLSKSEYFKNIFVQIFGTGVAQLIPFLITPLLSRIFTKEDFAVYTSFIAFVAVFSVACGGRYQYAIVLPKKNEDAEEIFFISIFLNLFYALILQVIVSLLYIFSIDIFNLQDSILLVPLYILCQGLWLSATNLAIRQKKFKRNALAKIVQTSSNATSTLFFGFAGLLNGLIFGRLVGVILSVFYQMRKLSARPYSQIRISELKATALKYISFPKHTIYPSLLNAFSTQAPVFFIGEVFAEEILGYYGFTLLVIAGPLSIVSISFRDVFYQKISEAFYLGKIKSVYRIYKINLLILALIGTPVVLIFFFFGEPIFCLIFGAEWKDSGVYSSILTIGFVVKFVVSPLSVIFNVTDKLKTLKFWQITYFFTSISTLLVISSYFDFSILNFLKIYVFHEILLYLFYLFLQRRAMASINK